MILHDNFTVTNATALRKQIDHTANSLWHDKIFNKNAVALSHVQYDQGIIWVQKLSLAETGVNKKCNVHLPINKCECST